MNRCKFEIKGTHGWQRSEASMKKLKRATCFNCNIKVHAYWNCTRNVHTRQNSPNEKDKGKEIMLMNKQEPERLLRHTEKVRFNLTTDYMVLYINHGDWNHIWYM